MNAMRPARPPAECEECPVRTLTSYFTMVENDPKMAIFLRREVVFVPARRVILRQGEVPAKFFTLYDGWAFRFVLLPDGRRQILSFLVPGDLIANQAINISPLSFSVKMITDATLCAFDAMGLMDALHSNTAARERVTARYAREAEEADERIVGLGRRTTVERVARLIIKLTNKMRRSKFVLGESFEFPLRQKHIADALGMTAMSVSRTISILRNEGVISFDHKTITINDRQKLIEIADFIR